MILGMQTVYANDSKWESEEDVSNQIQNELQMAEADMESDEDLFMDEGDEGGDWAEEEATETAEEETTPTPPPVAEETPKTMPEPEKLEEPAPAPKPVAEKKPTPKAKPKMKAAKKRVPASFKQGFKVLSKNCNLYTEQNMTSSVILTTTSGKKLWLEGAGSNWYKGYHKNGHGYFPAECF